MQSGNSIWRPSPAAPRVFLKDLPASDGYQAQLVRYQAGASLKLDILAGPTFLYILQGELIHQGHRLWPGCTQVVQPSSEVVEVRSDIGCTFLCVRWEESAGRIARRR